MLDLQAVQLALRARLLTLSVVTTGTTSLSATATGYARSVGSFVTDGFAVGMEVVPSGFTQTAPGVVLGVTALTLDIAGGRTVEAAAGGRSLDVGVPTLRAYDNIALTPVAGRPYLEEEFIPATSRLLTMPADGGAMEDTGLYILRWYGATNTGLAHMAKAASALLALFKAGTSLSIAAGVTVWVRSDVGPTAGPIRIDAPGWAVRTITVPWRLAYLNT